MTGIVGLQQHVADAIQDNLIYAQHQRWAGRVEQGVVLLRQRRAIDQLQRIENGLPQQLQRRAHLR